MTNIVVTNLVVTLGPMVRHNSCYDEACLNSCYNKAGSNSCYDEAGRNSYYDEAGCIGILLGILRQAKVKGW